MLDLPTPIFVIGMNRSGTKWLSNLLANHSDVASVQAEYADGIMETNILYPAPRKFDFSRDDDYAAFLTLWNLSDFVQATGIDVVAFARRKPQPRTPAELFATLMNQYTQQQGKSMWLQKIGPESAESVARDFPHARFIVIFRDVVDTVHSAYHLAKDQGQTDSLISTTFGFVLAEKQLRRVARQTHACVTRYDWLQNEPRRELIRACEHVQLTFSESLLQVAYQPNSTFRNKATRHVLTTPERMLVRSLAAGLRVTPEWILRTYAQFRPYSRATVPFVPGTFHSLVNDILMQSPMEASGSRRDVETLRDRSC